MNMFDRRKATEYGGNYYQSASYLRSNKMQVLRQPPVFCEFNICKLRVFDIASQRILSLSHFELQANRLASCNSASLWVAILQIINLEAISSYLIIISEDLESTYKDMNYYFKEHAKLSVNFVF